MSRDPRASVTDATAFGESLGYRITETDLLDIDDEVMVRFAGYGEEVEAYFRRDPDTGYLRFNRGGHVLNFSSDRISSWKGVRGFLAMIQETAAELGWSADREPADEE